MELNLFSHVELFKLRHFHIEIRDDTHFGEICDFLTKSGKFRCFTYADTEMFTDRFRKSGEISRTFELKEPIKVLNLSLIKTSLSGEIRFFLTVYRAGFVVLSLLHSIVPMKTDSVPIGKNLTSKECLDFSDIVFLVKEKNPKDNAELVYELQFQNHTLKMKSPELVEHLLKELQIYEKEVEKQPSTNSYVIHFWNPDLSTSFQKILKVKYRDLFYVFVIPQVSQPAETEKEMLRKLKDHIFWSSKTRGFLFRKKAMIIVSPVSQAPNKVFKTQLPWLFQLAVTQNFMLQFYSWRVKEFVSRLERMVSSKPSELMSQFIRLTASFSVGLENLYWVEESLFRMHAEQFMIEYKKRFELEKQLELLQKRISLAKERCTEGMAALQQKTEREREKSITYLTLIFATFGLGEILSNFVVWYFNYYQFNNQLPDWIIITGFAIPFAAIVVVYAISRQYVRGKFKPMPD